MSKTKLRKVKRGLAVSVACVQGEKETGKKTTHTVYLTPKGHLVLSHHPDADLTTDLALKALGGSGCRCAEIMSSWRIGNYSTDIPYTLGYVRPIHLNARLGARLWRLTSRKQAYRKPKPKWPMGQEDIQSFLTELFGRVGLKVEPIQVYVGNNNVKNEVNNDYQTVGYNIILEYSRHRILPAYPALASPHWQVDVTVDLTKNKKLIIQSNKLPALSPRRFIDKSNIDCIVKLIGEHLWKMKAESVLDDMLKLKADDAQKTLNRMICKHNPLFEYPLSTEATAYVPKYNENYISDNRVHLAMELPGGCLNSLPFIFKKLAKAFEVSHELMNHRQTLK